MAHNGGGLAVQLPDIGRLVGHFDGVVTQVNGVKNEIAKFNNLAPLAQADAILRQLQQMQQDQQDYRQQAREDQQDYRQQAQEDQRILREQITDMQQGLRDVQDELRLQGRSLNDMRQQITDEFVQLEQRVQDRLRTVQQDIIAGVNGNINQLRADLNQLREAMITSQKAM